MTPEVVEPATATVGGGINGVAVRGHLRAWRHYLRWQIVLPSAYLLALVVAAIIAPWIAPYHYSAQDLAIGLAGPNGEHLLGTDHIGRDILSRLIYGTRPTLIVGISSAALAAVAGTIIGLVAGFYTGWRDSALMRVMDLILGIPALLLAMTVIAIGGRQTATLIIAIALVGIPVYARLARAGTLRVRDREYVKAAKLAGAKDRYLLFRSILPNIAPELYVQVVVFTAAAILIEASLSFLGLGLPPPTPTWGGMIFESKRYMALSPTYGLFAGLVLTATIFVIDILAHALADDRGPVQKASRRSGSAGR